MFLENFLILRLNFLNHRSMILVSKDLVFLLNTMWTLYETVLYGRILFFNWSCSGTLKKEHRDWNQTAWVYILTLVTGGFSLNLFVTQFSMRKVGLVL